MKFYKRDIPGLYLPGTVWNPERRRQWCSFDENAGVVETEDAGLIAVLLGFGFPHDGEAIVEKVEPEAVVIADAEKAEAEEHETVETDSVEVVEIADAKTEELKEVVIEDDGILATEPQIKDSKAAPTYKTKTELRKLNKVELEAYALETFGVQIDRRHNWMQLQKEIASLGAALGK